MTRDDWMLVLFAIQVLNIFWLKACHDERVRERDVALTRVRELEVEVRLLKAEDGK